MNDEIHGNAYETGKVIAAILKTSIFPPRQGMILFWTGWITTKQRCYSIPK